MGVLGAPGASGSTKPTMGFTVLRRGGTLPCAPCASHRRVRRTAVRAVSASHRRVCRVYVTSPCAPCVRHIDVCAVCASHRRVRHIAVRASHSPCARTFEPQPAHSAGGAQHKCRRHSSLVAHSSARAVPGAGGPAAVRRMARATRGAGGARRSRPRTALRGRCTAQSRRTAQWRHRTTQQRAPGALRRQGGPPTSL